MSLEQVEIKYRDIASLVKLKEAHPSMNTAAIIDMLKEVLYNGSSRAVPNQPALPDLKIAGGKNNSRGRPNEYDKKFELIGTRAPGTISTKYDENPFGVKVGWFERCERKGCGLVGIVSFSLHKRPYGKKVKDHIMGGPHTYLYKEWTHEAGNHHYLKLAQFEEELTWEEIVSKAKRRGLFNK